MIGWLSGSVISKQANVLIINVGGVGYELTVPLSVIENTAQNQMIEVFVHHAQREDGQYLFGFSSLHQRELFRELVRVSGIGPKLAVLILSGFTNEALVQTIREQNSAALVKLPGIGKKTAERLLVELKDRVGKKFVNFVASDNDGNQTSTLNLTTSAADEAVEALIALELKPAEAIKLVESALKSLPEDADSAAVIKAALSLKLQGAR